MMNTFSLDELKSFQLDILRKVAAFCESHNLCYFLTYGTLLGAIRHKGYIPWDDDIDIMMPREDYNTFINVFNGQVSDLRVMAPELDPDYYAPYANVYDERTVMEEDLVSHGKHQIGIKIDIFPLDYVPSDDNAYDDLWRRSKKNTSLLFVKTKKISFFHGAERLKLIVLKLFYLFMPIRTIQKKHLELINGIVGDDTYLDMIALTEKHKTRVLKEDLFPVSKACFEGYEFNVPKNSDSVLRVFYGDYMQLPPESERNAIHCFKAYWK